MNENLKLFQEVVFERNFLKKKSNEFQDFFSEIMELRFPADFIRTRPWGKQGDRKNDGYLKSKKMLFQVYAPNELEASVAIRKIDEDFSEALIHWDQYIDTWIFVHNSRTGLGPEIVKKLLDLERSNPQKNIAHWGYVELREKLFELQLQDLSSVLQLPASYQECINWPFLLSQYSDEVLLRGNNIFSRPLFGNNKVIDNDLSLLPQARANVDHRSILPVEELVFRERLCLLIGGYGTGKSHLLRSIFLSQIKAYKGSSDGYFPIYLDLSAFPSADIDGMIDAEITRILRISPTKQSTRLLELHKIILLIDGIEELTSVVQAQAALGISRIARDYPKCNILVAARPSWNGWPQIGQAFRQFDLIGLSDEQQRTIFVKQCPDKDWYRIPHGVRELCEVPIHLQMVLDEARHGVATISSTPAALFDRFFEHRLADLTHIEEFGAITNIMYLLAAKRIAVHCIKNGGRGISVEAIFESVEGEKSLTQISKEKILRGLQRASILTAPTDSGVVSFTHMALRDYLGALYLVDKLAGGESVDQIIKSSNEWCDAIIFTAGKLTNFELQSKLLKLLWRSDRFVFFSALKNRNALSDAKQTLSKDLISKLILQLAECYSDLTNGISGLARGLLDPFVFHGILEGDVSIFAKVSSDYKIINYQYAPSRIAKTTISITDVQQSTVTGPDGAITISSYNISDGTKVSRHINFNQTLDDLFCIHEIACDDFQKEIEKIFNTQSSIILTPDMAYEYVYDKYNEIKNIFGNKPTISFSELASMCHTIRQRNAARTILLGSSRVPLDLFQYAIEVARKKYDHVGNALLPGQDIPWSEAKGGYSWHVYSPDRTLEIVNKAVLMILDNYRECVDTYFPGYADYLPLRSAMPVKFHGQLYRHIDAREFLNGEYVLRRWLEPIAGSRDEVDVQYFESDPKSGVHFDPAQNDQTLIKLGRRWRVASLALNSLADGFLDIGHEKSFIRETVFSLLSQDFSRLFQATHSSNKLRSALF